MRIRTVITAACLALTATAGRAEVSAFGYTLGATTYTDVKGQGTTSGINRYSNGPMLEVPASRFNLQGLESVLLIFGEQRKLAAIVLDMRKSRFDAVRRHMVEKYAVRESRIPHVGNRYVRLGAPGATMEIIAPHMSFSMSVLYQRDDFYFAYKKQKEQDRQNKQQREGELF